MTTRLPLTPGGTIVAATGGLFLADLFLPWHRTCVEVFQHGLCVQQTGLNAPFSLLAGLLVVALLTEVIAVQVVRADLPEPGQLRLVASAVVVVLVLLQLIAGDDGLDSGYGLFVGLVLAAGLTYGNYRRTGELTSRPVT